MTFEKVKMQFSEMHSAGGHLKGRNRNRKAVLHDYIHIYAFTLRFSVRWSGGPQNAAIEADGSNAITESPR